MYYTHTQSHTHTCTEKVLTNLLEVFPKVCANLVLLLYVSSETCRWPHTDRAQRGQIKMWWYLEKVGSEPIKVPEIPLHGPRPACRSLRSCIWKCIFQIAFWIVRLPENLFSAETTKKGEVVLWESHKNASGKGEDDKGTLDKSPHLKGNDEITTPRCLKIAQIFL